MILGLTGGIGSGKSTVSKILKENGVKIFDADIIAKNILQSYEAKKEIEEKIGKQFILETGDIDKLELKKFIFSNKEALNKLNNIIHPKVIEFYKKINLEYKDKKEIVVFDIPLLYETNLDKYCDLVMVVDIDFNTQVDRIMARDNISKELAINIINNQISNKSRKEKADILIKNNGTMEELKNNVLKILEELKRGK
nr:dephospho-CoA kinase [uncultured Cetobacterium sp.]